MSNNKKRVYRSESRQTQAVQTRNRILAAARTLFESDGFVNITIEKLAKAAEVSGPTVYALFQSKHGVLRALMDDALPSVQFEALVEQVRLEKSAQKRLLISAKIARQIYDAEKAQMAIFQGASVLSPEFKELEQEKEKRRYERQEETIQTMAKENSLADGLSVSKARDILWALTGRDMYRMFVVERGWSSDEYETWLGQLLVRNLVNN